MGDVDGSTLRELIELYKYGDVVEDIDAVADVVDGNRLLFGEL